MASEPARARLLRAILFLARPVTFGHTTPCRSRALTFSAAMHFAMKHSAPCSAILRHSPSSWAAVVHRSVLIPKAPRSSRKNLIYSVSWPPTQPTPPTSSPNIKHFGSLVASTRDTFAVNKIQLRRIIAAMSSLPVFLSVSKYLVGIRIVCAIVLPTDEASQEAVAGLAQRVVMTLARGST